MESQILNENNFASSLWTKNERMQKSRNHFSDCYSENIEKYKYSVNCLVFKKEVKNTSLKFILHS